MDADIHGLDAGLTGAVIGSALEGCQNTGAGFVEKLYGRAQLREPGPPKFFHLFRWRHTNSSRGRGKMLA
jgi:hypothetical protein